MGREKPHYIGHKKRLKERFLTCGIEALADYEVLELVLSLSQTRRDVKELAKELLERFGSYDAVFDASPDDLARVRGVGPSSIAAIKLVKDASVRYLERKTRRRCVVSSPEALIDYCRAAMQGLRNEEFRVIFLNTKNEVIGDEVVSSGTLDHTVVHPRKVIERAIHHNAAALIFVHNHPSGHPHPSNADFELTRTLSQAARYVQIKVLDHMIIGKDGHYSFAREGRL